MQKHPLETDLNHILEHSESLWRELNGAKLFLTGCTGFLGIWLLESLLWAEKHLNIKLNATVLSRNSQKFCSSYPSLSTTSSIRFHDGDIRNYTFPPGNFSHFIHGAASSALATYQKEDPLIKFDTIIQGTERTLNFAQRSGVKHFLFLSSGAVYGRGTQSTENFSENNPLVVNSTDPLATWGIAKIAAEQLCALYAEKFNMNIKIARCFSFYGPHLPLDIHYAIGNFIRDGLSNEPIKVHGDGTASRSYLYVADWVIWLLTILVKGRNMHPYNVGSESALSIEKLAHTVADCFAPKPVVHIEKKNLSSEVAPNYYIPNTKCARDELGLIEWISLNNGLKKMIQFYKKEKIHENN